VGVERPEQALLHKTRIRRQSDSGALVSGWALPHARPASRTSPADTPASWSDDPTIIGATGGSGTRVLAAILQRAGVFMGADLNKALDAMALTVFFDLWINIFVGRETIFDNDEARCLDGPMARSLAAALRNHWGESEFVGQPWGWKAGRSMFLLPFFHSQLPSLRFIHLVRDGRDMAYSPVQKQLKSHGSMFLTREERRYSTPVQQTILWSRANLAAANYGEHILGDRYLRIRFEELCADPISSVRRLLDFVGLNVDAKELATLVQPPATIGRWRQHDPREARKLHRFGREALRKFNYIEETPPSKSRRAHSLPTSSARS
jgi:Sulfotransferase family